MDLIFNAQTTLDFTGSVLLFCFPYLLKKPINARHGLSVDLYSTGPHNQDKFEFALHGLRIGTTDERRMPVSWSILINTSQSPNMGHEISKPQGNDKNQLKVFSLRTDIKPTGLMRYPLLLKSTQLRGRPGKNHGGWIGKRDSTGITH